MQDKLTTELLNKRVLLSKRYVTMDPIEFQVNEFSPEGKYVKLQGLAGTYTSNSWYTASEWCVMSVLPDKALPQNPNYITYGGPFVDQSKAIEEFLKLNNAPQYDIQNANRGWLYADGTPMPNHLAPKEIQ